MSPSLFGTDGIRSEANHDPLTPAQIVKIGQALGLFWSRSNSPFDAVLLGEDGRRSGDLVRCSLASGLMSVGWNVHDLGLCTTPSLAYLTARREVRGGVMISASHNPYFDNGIKPFQSTGEKLTSEEESEIERMFHQNDVPLSNRADIGTSFEHHSWISEYLEGVSHRNTQFDGHVVLDCSHGGASHLAPAVLREICTEMTVIHNEPNGTNINEDAGSTHPEALKKEVQQRDADVGFAFDGDGDRVIGVDERGRTVDGDVFMYMLAMDRKSKEKLPGNGLVITVMSNLGLRHALEKEDVEYEVVGVGDRVVYRRMKELGWELGGEQSGHIIDRDWLSTGDGLNTLFSILDVLQRSGMTLGEIADKVPRYPQILHNVEVNEKIPLSDLPETQDVIEDVEQKLGDEGRVLVRYSGTQPLARIMLEGPDEDTLNHLASDIADALKEELAKREDETP